MYRAVGILSATEMWYGRLAHEQTNVAEGDTLRFPLLNFCHSNLFRILVLRISNFFYGPLTPSS